MSHRLFTEQELTFPQTRPHPEGKRKARPRTCLEQTPTRPDGAAVSRASSARAGAGQGPGQGPPRVPTCPPRDLCWVSGRNQDAHGGGLQPLPRKQAPGGPVSPTPTKSRSPDWAGGRLGSLPPGAWPRLLSLVRRPSAQGEQRDREGAMGGHRAEEQPRNPLLWGSPSPSGNEGPQGPVPKASAGQGPAWALPSAPSASGCTWTRRARGPGGSRAAAGTPQPQHQACPYPTPPGPSADPGTPT